MSGIVKLKRKSQPSSPIPKPFPTSSSKPSSSKEHSFKAEQQVPQFVKKCPKCKANIINRNGSFKRHVERHAKLARLQAANINVPPAQAEDPDFDVDLARDMWLSTPAKHRAAGGVFLDGPLAGKGTFDGMPEVFLPNGRVKNKCVWIKKDYEAGRPGRTPLKTLKNINAAAGSFDVGVDEDGDVTMERGFIKQYLYSYVVVQRAIAEIVKVNSYETWSNLNSPCVLALFPSIPTLSEARYINIRPCERGYISLGPTRKQS